MKDYKKSSGELENPSRSKVTVITTERYCNKRVRIDKNGIPQKTSHGAGASMIAETRVVPDVDVMAALLREIADDTCKCLAQGYFPGIEPGESFQIMSLATIQRVQPGYTGGWTTVNGKRTIARLKADMRPSTWMQLDRDYAPGLPAEWADMTDAEWLAAVDAFSPGVAAAGHVRVASTSGRVLVDGVPMDASGCRYWMQLQDPSDYFNYGQRMKMAAASAGWGFRKPFKNHRGVLWSIFDPTVFSWERLVYDGKPHLVAHERLSLAPPDITVQAGGSVDTHACVMPDDLQAIRDEYGLTVTSSAGRLSAVASGYLELGTKVETERGKMTVMEFADSEYEKLRCQATFRESESWNGILRKVGGIPFLYDNGTHTKYELSEDARLALSMRPVEALVSALKKPAARPKSVNRAELPDVELGENGPLRVQLATDANITYVAKVLDRIPRFNVMKQDLDVDVEAHCALVQSDLLRVGIRCGPQMVMAILRGLAEPYHPFEDYVKGLAWDGHDYIGDLAATVTTPTPLWDVYLRKWLIQVAAGVCDWRDGGQQLPHVLVFSGEHGLGKSTWFKNLVPKKYFFPEAALRLNTPHGKDDAISALKHVIVELAEIDTTFSKSQVGQLKSFISAPTNDIRVPYGMVSKQWPRMTSFCGTVNHYDFLKDDTGNRRFWPVHATAIDKRHQVPLEGVWAQAYAMYTSGETFYLTAEETALHAQVSEDCRVANAMEDFVDGYFDEETMAIPKSEWMAVNTTELCRIMGTGNVSHPGHRSDLAKALRGRFGGHRRLQGKRKAYLCPIKVGDRLAVTTVKKPLKPA